MYINQRDVQDIKKYLNELRLAARTTYYKSGPGDLLSQAINFCTKALYAPIAIIKGSNGVPSSYAGTFLLDSNSPLPLYSMELFRSIAINACKHAYKKGFRDIPPFKIEDIIGWDISDIEKAIKEEDIQTQYTCSTPLEYGLTIVGLDILGLGDYRKNLPSLSAMLYNAMSCNPTFKLCSRTTNEVQEESSKLLQDPKNHVYFPSISKLLERSLGGPIRPTTKTFGQMFIPQYMHNFQVYSIEKTGHMSNRILYRDLLLLSNNCRSGEHFSPEIQAIYTYQEKIVRDAIEILQSGKAPQEKDFFPILGLICAAANVQLELAQQAIHTQRFIETYPIITRYTDKLLNKLITKYKVLVKNPVQIQLKRPDIAAGSLCYTAQYKEATSTTQLVNNIAKTTTSSQRKRSSNHLPEPQNTYVPAKKLKTTPAQTELKSSAIAAGPLCYTAPYTETTSAAQLLSNIAKITASSQVEGSSAHISTAQPDIIYIDFDEDINSQIKESLKCIPASKENIKYIDLDESTGSPGRLHIDLDRDEEDASQEDDDIYILDNLPVADSREVNIQASTSSQHSNPGSSEASPNVPINDNLQMEIRKIVSGMISRIVTEEPTYNMSLSDLQPIFDELEMLARKLIPKYNNMYKHLIEPGLHEMCQDILNHFVASNRAATSTTQLCIDDALRWNKISTTLHAKHNDVLKDCTRSFLSETLSHLKLIISKIEVPRPFFHKIERSIANAYSILISESFRIQYIEYVSPRAATLNQAVLDDLDCNMKRIKNDEARSHSQLEAGTSGAFIEPQQTHILQSNAISNITPNSSTIVTRHSMPASMPRQKDSALARACPLIANLLEQEEEDRLNSAASDFSKLHDQAKASTPKSDIQAPEGLSRAFVQQQPAAQKNSSPPQHCSCCRHHSPSPFQDIPRSSTVVLPQASITPIQQQRSPVQNPGPQLQSVVASQRDTGALGALSAWAANLRY